MTHDNPLDILVARAKLPITVRCSEEGVLRISKGRLFATTANAEKATRVYLEYVRSLS